MAKVLISMSEELLTQIDALANSEERSRSELIREALRQYFKSLRSSASVALPVRRVYPDISSYTNVYHRQLLATNA